MLAGMAMFFAEYWNIAFDICVVNFFSGEALC
jgi:hypothetical protein